MPHRIFFEAVDSTDGFQTDVMECLDARIHPECVLMTIKTDGGDSFEEDKYIVVNYDICEQNRYDEIADIESLLPLDAELMTALKPYELMAVRMLIRNYERDIYTLDESMTFYLRHVRFWHHMLKVHEIDFAFFNVTPHHTHDYVIYALCRVLGIKTCMCISTNFQNRYFLARTLDSAHIETFDIYYNKYKDMDPDRIVLPQDVETYYNTILKGSKEQMRKQALQGNSMSQEVLDKKALYTTDLSFKKILRKNLSDYKHKVLKAKSRQERTRALERIAFRWGLYKRDRIKQRFMVGIDYYNSLAGEPVEGEDYVIYFLHYQPEATTIPQGGIFHDQELALAIMARAAEQVGLKLYVKEHFVQYRRPRIFYDGIASIPNVRLIRSDINSRDLTDKSYCVATGNGTVVLESVIRGTPMVVFGETGFGRCPGVHKVSSLAEAIAALEEAGRERKAGIPQRDIRAYLAAFAENSLYSCVYGDKELKKTDPNYAISRDALVEVMCRRMEED